MTMACEMAKYSLMVWSSGGVYAMTLLEPNMFRGDAIDLWRGFGVLKGMVEWLARGKCLVESQVDVVIASTIL